jgi:hypothetical protein
MNTAHPDCESSRDSSCDADHGPDQDLLDHYTAAIAHVERALEVVDELIGIVQSGADCEFPSVALQACCGQIAQADARIQAAQGTASPKDRGSGDRIMDAAERHMTALSRLCERIRFAEHAATLRLQTLSPDLDASIRGKQMVSAYRQRRA